MVRSEKLRRWLGIALLAIALDARAVRADIDPQKVLQIICTSPDSIETIDMPNQTWTDQSRVPVAGVPPIIYAVTNSDLDGTTQFTISGDYSAPLSKDQKPEPPVIYSSISSITLDTHDTRTARGMAKDAYRTGKFDAIIDRKLVSGKREHISYHASCHFVVAALPNLERDLP